MTVISKTAGVLSLISSLKDIHETALIYSKNETAKATSDTFISTSLATQKTNRLSKKDTRRKNWVIGHMYTVGLVETGAGIKGYLKGVFNGVCKYFPNIILSALAIGLKSKHKKLANICAIGLGALEGYDLLCSTTGLDQRKDYLKIK